MRIRKYIEQTKKYLEYLEEHINNVERSWVIILETCGDFDVIKNKSSRKKINERVLDHDVSKMSVEEFVQYRMRWFPVEGEDLETAKELFSQAWENHKKENPHHWETWTKEIGEMEGSLIENMQICSVDMVIDWLAMSLKFGDSPRGFYEKNQDRIKIPKESIDFIYKIFDRIDEYMKKDS